MAVIGFGKPGGQGGLAGGAEAVQSHNDSVLPGKQEIDLIQQLIHRGRLLLLELGYHGNYNGCG